MPALDSPKLPRAISDFVAGWFNPNEYNFWEYTSSLLSEKDGTLPLAVAGLLLAAVQTPYEVFVAVIEDKHSSGYYQSLIMLSQLATNLPVDVGFTSDQQVPVATHSFQQLVGGEEAYRSLHPLMREEMQRQAKIFLQSKGVSVEDPNVQQMLTRAYEKGADMVRQGLTQLPLTSIPNGSQLERLLVHAWRIVDVHRLLIFMAANPSLTAETVLDLLEKSRLNIAELLALIDVLTKVKPHSQTTRSGLIRSALTQLNNGNYPGHKIFEVAMQVPRVMARLDNGCQWIGPLTNQFEFTIAYDGLRSIVPGELKTLDRIISNYLPQPPDETQISRLVSLLRSLKYRLSLVRADDVGMSQAEFYCEDLAALLRCIQTLPADWHDRLLAAVKNIMRLIPLRGTGVEIRVGSFVSNLHKKYIPLAKHDGCLMEWLTLLESLVKQTIHLPNNFEPKLEIDFLFERCILTPSELGFGLWSRLILLEPPTTWWWLEYRRLTRRCWRLGDVTPPATCHPVFRVVQAIMDTTWKIESKLDAIKQLLDSKTALDMLARDPNLINGLIERIANSTDPTDCPHWLFLSPNLLEAIDNPTVAATLNMAPITAPLLECNNYYYYGAHEISPERQSALDAIRQIPGDARLAQAFAQVCDLFSDEPVQHDICHIVAYAQCLVGVDVIGDGLRQQPAAVLSTHQANTLWDQITTLPIHFFSVFGAMPQPVLHRDLLKKLRRSRLSLEHQIAVVKAVLATNTQSAIRDHQPAFQALVGNLVGVGVGSDSVVGTIQSLATVCSNKNDDEVTIILFELSAAVETIAKQSGNLEQTIRDKLEPMLAQQADDTAYGGCMCLY